MPLLTFKGKYRMTYAGYFVGGSDDAVGSMLADHPLGFYGKTPDHPILSPVDVTDAYQIRVRQNEGIRHGWLRNEEESAGEGT